MPINQETVTHHKDAGKYSGEGAEILAKKMGFHAYSKKIGAFVNKIVGKKQKAMIDQKAAEVQAKDAAHAQGTAPTTTTTATTTAPAEPAVASAPVTSAPVANQPVAATA